jgi:two-component system sensor histidine kinase PilS (NtrC family)
VNRLVSDFLVYARPRPARRETLRAAEMLGELIQLLGQGEHADARFELDVPDEVTLAGDPDQLRQAFLNLMLNAAQAGGDALVRVRAEASPADGPGVEIAIEDRGVGIPPGDLERIFEPFFTTRPKGTGLGLATVHRVIEAHGGSIEATSEVGKGTQIRVWLPVPPA